MPKTRLIIPMNDYTLITLRVGVEVSCEPPRVHGHRLLVLLIYGDVGGGGGSNVDSFFDGPLHQAEGTGSQIRVLSMGRPRIMVTSCTITMVSPHRRWNVWVSKRHRSTRAVKAAKSIIGRPPMTSRASGRNPECRMNDAYHSFHMRGLCVQIPSRDNCCGIQQ
jgi:hypothetical protein